MNGFEFNKLLAAILVAMLVAMLACFFAEKIVSPAKLEKKAYVVEGVAADASTPAAEAPKGPADIKPLLASADAEAGQKYARVCGSCHTFGKGEPARIGPNLYGIVMNKHAHMEGFSYSDGMMKMHDRPWDYEELNAFLYNPREHVPGTKMAFAGIKNDKDRANVIAYLRSLSDSPAPLPAK